MFSKWLQFISKVLLSYRRGRPKESFSFRSRLLMKFSCNSWNANASENFLYIHSLPFLFRTKRIKRDVKSEKWAKTKVSIVSVLKEAIKKGGRKKARSKRKTQQIADEWFCSIFRRCAFSFWCPWAHVTHFFCIHQDETNKRFSCA